MGCTDMKLDKIIEKLLFSAKNDTPSDHVPYAFEKRIMANITEQPQKTDSWLDLGRLLWRAVVPYTAVAVFAAATWLTISPAQNSHVVPSSDMEEVATMVIELPVE